MKKVIPLVLLASLGFTGAVMAEGFKSEVPPPPPTVNAVKQKITTVEEAKHMSKDSFVVLQGNIVKYLDKKDYVFKDSTGEINIKIKDKLWKGRTITPKDTLQISGEIDTHEIKPTDIEVKNIEVIPTAK